jgi:hypothetical protein
MKTAGERHEGGARRRRFDGFECMGAKTNTDRHPSSLKVEPCTQLPPETSCPTGGAARLVRLSVVSLDLTDCFESWLGLFEQFSGFYKWSLCRV